MDFWRRKKKNKKNWRVLRLWRTVIKYPDPGLTQSGVRIEAVFILRLRIFVTYLYFNERLFYKIKCDF